MYSVSTPGYGMITYYDNANRDLEVATCNDIACTNVRVFTLAVYGDMGSYSDVAFHPETGAALIVFYGTYIKLHCPRPACVCICLPCG